MSPTLTDIVRVFDCVCRDLPAHTIVLYCLPVLKREVICLLGRRCYFRPRGSTVFVLSWNPSQLRNPFSLSLPLPSLFLFPHFQSISGLGLPFHPTITSHHLGLSKCGLGWTSLHLNVHTDSPPWQSHRARKGSLSPTPPHPCRHLPGFLSPLPILCQG